MGVRDVVEGDVLVPGVVLPELWAFDPQAPSAAAPTAVPPASLRKSRRRIADMVGDGSLDPRERGTGGRRPGPDLSRGRTEQWT